MTQNKVETGSLVVIEPDAMGELQCRLPMPGEEPNAKVLRYADDHAYVSLLKMQSLVDYLPVVSQSREES